jgi:hypothetical protein
MVWHRWLSPAFITPRAQLFGDWAWPMIKRNQNDCQISQSPVLIATFAATAVIAVFFERDCFAPPAISYLCRDFRE